MCESTDQSYNIAIRYRTIKKRLDNIGYRDALSLDALPLVEKLLADLIQTTESLKHFKAIAENNIESCRQSLSIDSHNYDNTKLVEECNQLHTQLLEIKEKNLIQTKDLKRKIQRLESECSALQLASSRNLKRIKDIELESSNKSKRIQELLGKCCKPTISNVGLATKRRSVYPLKKPVLACEPLPKENINGGIEFPNLTKVNPEIVDLVAMADRKISSLNHEVIKLTADLSLQTDNVDTLKTQLTMREREINRLKKLHEGGRSYNASLTECSCRKNEPNCGQCNFTSRRTAGNCSQSACNKLADISEIKVLHQAKLNLEQQLRDALDKQHDAMSQAMKLAERNEELEKELRDIDHVALAVEADCNSTVKQTNKRVSQLQEKLENTMTKLRECENSLLVEKRMSQELRADLEASKLEKRNIQRTLDSALDEKKRLTDRINELTIIENDLNAEIGRLSKRNETQQYELVELQFVNDALKKQMNNENLAQNGRKNGARSSKDKNEKKNNNVAASNGERRSLLSSNNNNNNDNIIGKTFDDATNNGLKKMTDESKKLIEQLEHDRDHYKGQWNKLNEQMNKEVDTENAELWSQICDLKHQLNEKEAQISELQRDKRDLCREKFDFENRVQLSKSHGRRPCLYCKVCRSMSACLCPSAAPIGGEHKTGSGSKVVLGRLERERDNARADVERLTEERDILHERLKLATEAHTGEQRRLRDRLREIETKLDDVEKEKQNILMTQGSRQSTLSGLENQLTDARNELRMTKQELATQRTQYFQLRALQDQTDQALGDVQSQLIQSESELSKALDRNKNLDQQQLQLDNQIMELKQEINTLRTNMARLDREKDQLLMNLDEKTERIAALEREVMIKEQQTVGVDHQLRDLQHKNQICMDQSAEQERQLRNMQMEIENYQRQLSAASADREHAAQENKRLQNDLAAVAYDSRTLQRELEASRAESHDLKRQLQTYVSEVRRAEELLNKKENERTEMLNHFRSLSMEASVLENNNHSLESEAAEAKGALQSARDRITDLDGQLADKECQVRRYEAQIMELSKNVASLEIQVRQQMEHRSRAESDLRGLQDLCVKLDTEKDALLKDLENSNARKTRWESEMTQLKLDESAALNNRNQDRARIGSLEKMLEQERGKSMECHRTNQELQNEIGRLKQRVDELQSELSAESAELKRYQNQAAEYNRQISELRRQVTDEKYKRAKNSEDYRRSNQYSGEISGTTPEYNSGEPAHGTTPIVTFDTTSQDLSHGPPRHPQAPMIHNEPTRLINSIHEAERTNRFDAGIALHNDLPLYTLANDSEHTIVFAHGPSTGEPAQSTIAVPGVGPITLKATVEEDKNHKDIRLRIIEQSPINKRQLRAEAALKNAPPSSTNSERKETKESNTSVEAQIHDVDIVEKDEENLQKIADQMKNGILLKSSTSGEKKQLIIEKTASKLSFSDLLTNEKISKTSVRNEKDVTTKKTQNEMEMDISQSKKRKELCGCDINNQLSGCIVHKHVEFELNNNDYIDETDDEGYDTSRLPKLAERTPDDNINNNQTDNNFSLEKCTRPETKKNIEDSQSPVRHLPVPMIITQPNSPPVQINLEDGEIEVPTVELSHSNIDRQLTEMKEMAVTMHKQLELMNNLKSKHLNNDANDSNGKNGSDISIQKNKTHSKSSNVSEFMPSRMSTPIKSQTEGKSIEQQSSSKGLETKLSKSVIEYSDKTKIDYPSDDENGERCKISRSRTLILKSNHPNDKQQTSMRRKNTSEKGSLRSNKQSRRIEIKEKDSRSKLERSKVKYIERKDKTKLHDENSRECEINKCQCCPTKYKSLIPTRSPSTPRRRINVETQSSETGVEAGTSYSSADSARSLSRDRRQRKTPSPEISQTTYEHSSGRSKFYQFIKDGPIKCFGGTSSSDDQVVDESHSKNKISINTAVTSHNSNQQRSKRSHPQSTRDRTSPQPESASKKPVAVTCNVDTCH